MREAKRKAPKREDNMSIIQEALSVVSRLLIYKLTKRHPPTVPVHIMPGIPRFKWPAFSVIVSPTQPKRRIVPIAMALIKNVTVIS